MKTLTPDQLTLVRDKSLIYHSELERLKQNFLRDQLPLMLVFQEYFGVYPHNIKVAFRSEVALVQVDRAFRGGFEHEHYEIPLSVCTSSADIKKHFDKLEADAEIIRQANEAAQEKQEDEEARLIYEELKKRFEPK